MKFRRRTFVQLAAGAAALPAVSRVARADTYPSRPARIVVGFTAGGATDIQARLMGEWLSERLGQQYIVENKPGASGNIGTDTVAKAPADGYTLLQIVTPHAINSALYSNLSFDFMRDIAPVAYVARLAYVVVVNPSVPAKTIPELIAYAKANPGKINYGSAGQGTPQNISCELFKMMTGVDLLHVPYRGGAPALQDMLAGQVDMMFDNIPGPLAQVRAAWDRALAESVASFDPDLVVSAGFMKLVGPAFLDRFGGRFINTHPSLLPAFAGMNAVRDALEYGVKITGCTVFIVDEGVDAGPIVAQASVPVADDDDEATLHERIKVAERALLAGTVGTMVRDGWSVRGRKVRIGPCLETP